MMKNADAQLPIANSHDRREVDALREPVPAEDPEPEERRLEHERREALDRERCAEDVADELRVDRPVHPELELLHEPGRDADREVDEHERPEEAGRAAARPRRPPRYQIVCMTATSGASPSVSGTNRKW